MVTYNFNFLFFLCYSSLINIFLQIALGNILKFRKKNWQFDIIGGFIYFVLSFSMFPQVCICLVLSVSQIHASYPMFLFFFYCNGLAIKIWCSDFSDPC